MLKSRRCFGARDDFCGSLESLSKCRKDALTNDPIPRLILFTVSSPAFARTSAPKMIPVEATEFVSSVAQNTNLIAATSDDFGGYVYPVIGIGLLATLILYLSPPLADE
jgi:hypothetical protein